MPWWVFAFVSATAAALTAVLAKIGVKNVPSNLATAVRTLVVLPCDVEHYQVEVFHRFPFP